MNTRITTIALALACLAATGNVLADCGASGTIAGTRKAFNDGLRFERAGNITCRVRRVHRCAGADLRAEPGRSRCRASRRRAGVAAGQRRRKEGRLPESLRLLRHGRTVRRRGSRADGADTRAAGRPAHVQQGPRGARRTYAAGIPEQQQDSARHHGRVSAGSEEPRRGAGNARQGVARAFAKEAEAFNEQYLREYVARVQSRPDDLTDFEAMQAWGSAQQAFAQKWGDDRLEISRDAFSLVQSWIGVSIDQAWSDADRSAAASAPGQRVATLTASYSGAPKLLEHAIGFALAMNLDSRAGRVAAIKAQAGRLGDEASAKQRYGLAAEYFDVAGQDAKARLRTNSSASCDGEDAARDRPDAAAGAADPEGVQRSGQGEGHAGAGAGAAQEHAGAAADECRGQRPQGRRSREGAGTLDACDGPARAPAGRRGSRPCRQC